MQKIGVIGAGTMGHAIAGCFAKYGYRVSVYESFAPMHDSCKERIKSQYDFFCGEEMMSKEEVRLALNRITVFDDLKSAVFDADYVIEAIPEKTALKKELFNRLKEYCRSDTIFASNTSSISFAELTEELSEKDKSRIMICHWYNPAHLIPLVELSYFGNMKEETYQLVEDLYKSIQKKPAKVLKDVPGLLANRIQQAIAREVFSLMDMEAAKPEDIETALKYGPAFRYATTGQLEVADFGGLDIWCTVGDNLLPVMDRSNKASELLREKVRQGKTGFKSGEGFFKYPEEKKLEITEQFYKRLLIQLKASKHYD